MFAIITLGLNIKFSLVAQPGIKQQKKQKLKQPWNPIWPNRYIPNTQFNNKRTYNFPVAHKRVSRIDHVLLHNIIHCILTDENLSSGNNEEKLEKSNQRKPRKKM